MAGAAATLEVWFDPICDFTNELSGIWSWTPGRRWAHFLAALPPDEPADVAVLGRGKHLHDMANRAIYARNRPRSVRFRTLPQHFSLIATISTRANPGRGFYEGKGAGIMRDDTAVR